MRKAQMRARGNQNNTHRLTCDSAQERKGTEGWFCGAPKSIAMPHRFLPSLCYYFPPHHDNHDQHPSSSSSDCFLLMSQSGRAGRQIGAASPPLSEEGWQFRQTLKSWSHTCFGMRPRADQDRSGSELGCPTSGLCAVIDDQRLSRLHVSVGKEARIVLGPCFEGVDQVGPIETTKAMPHAHPFQSADQFQ
jgi:hypothetical protein